MDTFRTPLLSDRGNRQMDLCGNLLVRPVQFQRQIPEQPGIDFGSPLRPVYAEGIHHLADFRIRSACFFGNFGRAFALHFIKKPFAASVMSLGDKITE